MGAKRYSQMLEGGTSAVAAAALPLAIQPGQNQQVGITAISLGTTAVMEVAVSPGV